MRIARAMVLRPKTAGAGRADLGAGMTVQVQIVDLLRIYQRLNTVLAYSVFIQHDLKSLRSECRIIRVDGDEAGGCGRIRDC